MDERVNFPNNSEGALLRLPGKVVSSSRTGDISQVGGKRLRTKKKNYNKKGSYTEQVVKKNEGDGTKIREDKSFT